MAFSRSWAPPMLSSNASCSGTSSRYERAPLLSHAFPNIDRFALAGLPALALSHSGMALRQSHPYKRKSHVLPWCHVPPCHCFAVRDGPRVRVSHLSSSVWHLKEVTVQLDPCRVHGDGGILLAPTVVHVQEAYMALLLIRPMLLHQRPRPHFHMGGPVKSCAICGLLLHIYGFSR